MRVGNLAILFGIVASPALCQNAPPPKDGKLEAERLVDLTKHNYELEPNVTFTPDGKWVVFRSNMHGATQVYAVAVNKAG